MEITSVVTAQHQFITSLTSQTLILLAVFLYRLCVQVVQVLKQACTLQHSLSVVLFPDSSLCRRAWE